MQKKLATFENITYILSEELFMYSSVTKAIETRP